MPHTLLMLCCLGLGQTTGEEKAALMRAREQARTFLQAMQKDEFAKLPDLAWLTDADRRSSRARLTDAWTKKVTAQRRQGYHLDGAQIAPAKSLVKSGKEWLCIVPAKLRFRAVEGSASQQTYLLGLSADAGQTWRFRDGGDADVAVRWRAWLPKLPEGYALPSTRTLRLDAPDTDRFVVSSTPGNFKVSAPKRWEKGIPQGKSEAVVLERGGDVIFFMADPGNWTVEDLVQNYERPIGKPAQVRKLLGRQDRTVAGVRAKVFRFEQSTDLQLQQHFVCVFSHQGIGYRIEGIRRTGELKDFEDDFLSTLDRFGFLRERTEWLKQYGGEPTATALLGGLASFELPRPRWTEDTFDNQSDYAPLDYASFKLLPGVAFLRCSLFEAQGDAAAELNDLLASYVTRYQNTKPRRVTFGTSTGKLAGWEMEATIGGTPCMLWMTVILRDGVAAWLVLDMNRSLTEELRPDWNQLLDSFRLQGISKPEQPLAFPQRRNDVGRNGNLRVAELTKKGTRLYPNANAGAVVGFTSDGKQAIVNSNGYFLEDLATKKRHALPLKGTFANAVIVSPDRKFVAWQVGTEVTIHPLGFGLTRKIRAAGTLVAFESGNKHVLTIQSKHQSSSGLGAAYFNPFLTTKLERWPVDGQASSAVLDWPLIRVTTCAVSPDGKQIAVIANRDFPRTRSVGGYLYVCQADGKGLRLINRDHADYRRIGWSPDGKWIYALRRPLTQQYDRDDYDSFDVERISLANGSAVNLTRSGKIGSFWVGGPDLFIDFVGNNLAASQQGIYRFHASDLARDVKAGPAAPPQPAQTAAANIAKRLDKKLAGTPARQFVPTAASLAVLAQEFASAVRDELDLHLDGSPDSLDQIPGVVVRLNLASGKHPLNVLGAGAYYGETLRKALGAQWHLKPIPFGEWLPGLNPPGNGVMEIVHPFSDVYRRSMHDGFLVTSQGVRNRARGQDWLLVYPPAHVKQVMKNHAKDYLRARELLDKGDVVPALGILEAETKKRPRNGQLARELVSLFEAVGQMERAQAFAKKAAEDGTDVHDLLLMHAENLARTDPAKALPFYRKAAHTPYPPAATFFKMGNAYAKTGQRALAESCWRRAYFPASDAQRVEIRRQMGLPPRSPLATSNLGSTFDDLLAPLNKLK